MPTYDFNQNTMPSPEEFAQLLRERDEQYDPVEELLSLERELIHFEEKYNIPSSEFCQKYQQGEMGDAVEFVRWAGRYRLYLNLKEAISKSLKMVLTEKALVSA